LGVKIFQGKNKIKRDGKEQDKSYYSREITKQHIQENDKKEINKNKGVQMN
jgi:hypothetical protein